MTRNDGRCRFGSSSGTSTSSDLGRNTPTSSKQWKKRSAATLRRRRLSAKQKLLGRQTKAAEVMQLLRQHRISQGKAAFLLGLTRWELFDLMATYEISAIDLTPEELEK